jgi:glucuronoarabinoxylan endo-1,4-beta-xylanase
MLGKALSFPAAALVTSATWPTSATWATSIIGAGALLGAACIQHPPAASAGAAPAQPAFAAVVTIIPAERHQTLEGFGASIGWQQDKLVPNPPPGIYQLLFPDLGLDILRFRNRYQRTTKPEDGNLAQDVEIFRQASAALGHPPKVMLSAWSPPAALKANHKEDCAGNADCTLIKEDGKFVYEKFAAWWRDSLVHYAELGIVPEWVSIENEPSFIPPSWEGCKFDPTESAAYPGYDRALTAVHAQLATLPRPPKMLGPEVLGIHWGLLEKYVKPMNQDLVYGVAHHLYERGPDGIWDWMNPGPDSFVDEMQAAAALTKKPLFQTEFQTDEDKHYLGGFETAWLIHHSLVEEGVVSFLYWDLIWVNGGGLVSIDGGVGRARDQYYSVRHYARFTDPGDVRVGTKSDAPAVRASAFLSPAGDRLTAILLNTGDRPAEVRIDAGAFSATGSAVYRTVYRPKASETWVALGALPAGRVVSLPGRSVATVVLTGRTR